MTEQDIRANLVLLAEELYAEGCMSGINGPDADRWFNSWAEAMRRVAQGQPYTDLLVIEIYNGN